jgi:hypothetical protein
MRILRICDEFDKETLFEGEEHFESFFDQFCYYCPKRLECTFEKCDNNTILWSEA